MHRLFFLASRLCVHARPTIRICRSDQVATVQRLTKRLFWISIVQQVTSIILFATLLSLSLSNVSALLSSEYTGHSVEAQYFSKLHASHAVHSPAHSFPTTASLLPWILCCSTPLMAGISCAGMQGWVSIRGKDRASFQKYATCTLPAHAHKHTRSIFLPDSLRGTKPVPVAGLFSCCLYARCWAPLLPQTASSPAPSKWASSSPSTRLWRPYSSSQWRRGVGCSVPPLPCFGMSHRMGLTSLWQPPCTQLPPWPRNQEVHMRTANPWER